MRKMLARSGEWLRAGLGLKLNQVKTATRSYLRDRAQQASPPKLDQADAAKAAAAVLMASPTPPRRPSIRPPRAKRQELQIGLVVMAALVSLAAARQRRPSPETRS